MSSFIKGTIVFMITLFITKLLGFVFRIQFVRIAGEQAVGFFSTVYPTFIFFLSILQLGLPIAVAKLTAEHLAKKNYSNLSSLRKKTWQIAFVTFIVVTPILLWSIPFIARVLLKNEQLAIVLVVALITVPFSTISSIIKGFLQGMNKIHITAWANLLEQLFRILLVTTLLPLLVVIENPIRSAVVIMFFTLLAEIFSLIYLLYHYNKNTKKIENTPSYDSREILQIALPSSGSRIFGSFTWFLEPIIFIHALAIAGVTAIAASELYGIISGVLIPLLLFPAFISYALSVALIPAVSDAKARSNNRLLQKRIHLSLRISAVTGTLAACLFYLHGEHIVEVFFHIKNMGPYMHLLAPVFFFYYIQSPLHSILQALHEARAAFFNSIYGGVGKLFVLFYLASKPGLEEVGAILGIGFGVLLTSFLHIATLRGRKETGIGFFFFFWTYATFVIITILRPLIWPIEQLPWLADSAITMFFAIALLMLTKQIKFTDFHEVLSILKRSASIGK